MFHVKHSVFLPQNNDRIRLYGHGVPCPPVSGKEYPVGNVPPERFQNQETASGTQGRSSLVRSALEKLPLFSPPFPVRQKHGAGISLSADSDSEGCSPSENTSPAALSWSSLFGATVLKSFCSCTMVFVFALAVFPLIPAKPHQKRALHFEVLSQNHTEQRSFYASSCADSRKIAGSYSIWFLS